ncbi:unnamed protein product [Didymodactylos carnosus]|uniref:Uncharacterized protein n=1 Tax=Didymodactylos carnosus TaxID=1234261 RepID=A0A813U932_9BILA|nr:unnamed protein product [Didymodactylos carnosus]CAF0959194.1 unnamed protein product [Didymodactylos carnosus]CAF3611033.1 unnamed protein product [Didymodactylos carnosus]CAF3732009.1 unnamed protein product [Didymodactylos carnosus]
MVNPLTVALGPIGGLAACACCLIIAAIWGLFATMIALAVYTKRWKTAIEDAGFGSSNGMHMILSQSLLIGLLLVYGYIGIRRLLRS